MNKTLKRLIDKVETDSSLRMPSITAIHNLLTEYKIEHKYKETKNIVEYRSGNNSYVNSRHDGKVGKEIIVRNGSDTHNIVMDTSSSYYSFNTYRFATELVELFRALKHIK